MKYLKEIERLKKEHLKIKQQLDIISKPYHDKMEKIISDINNLSYTEVRQWVKEGRKIGARWHYCSPFEEIDLHEFSDNGWESLEEYMKRIPAEWYTIDDKKITKSRT